MALHEERLKSDDGSQQTRMITTYNKVPTEQKLEHSEQNELGVVDVLQWCTGLHLSYVRTQSLRDTKKKKQQTNPTNKITQNQDSEENHAEQNPGIKTRT